MSSTIDPIRSTLPYGRRIWFISTVCVACTVYAKRAVFFSQLGHFADRITEYGHSAFSLSDHPLARPLVVINAVTITGRKNPPCPWQTRATPPPESLLGDDVTSRLRILGPFCAYCFPRFSCAVRRWSMANDATWLAIGCFPGPASDKPLSWHGLCRSHRYVFFMRYAFCRKYVRFIPNY